MKKLLFLIVLIAFGVAKAQTCEDHILKTLQATKVSAFENVTSGEDGRIYIVYPFDGATYESVDDGSGTTYSAGTSAFINTKEINVGAVTALRTFTIRVRHGACTYELPQKVSLHPITTPSLQLRKVDEYCTSGGAVFFQMMGTGINPADYTYHIKKVADTEYQSTLLDYQTGVTNIEAGEYQVRAKANLAPFTEYTATIKVLPTDRSIDFDVKAYGLNCAGRAAVGVEVKRGNYPLYFSLYDQTGTTEIRPAQTSPYFDNLDPNTVYRVFVRDFCSAGGGNAENKEIQTRSTNFNFVPNPSGHHCCGGFAANFVKDANGCPASMYNQMAYYIPDLSTFYPNNFQFPIQIKYQMTSPSGVVYSDDITFNSIDEMLAQGYFEEGRALYVLYFKKYEIKVGGEIRSTIPVEFGTWQFTSEVFYCGKKETFNHTSTLYEQLASDSRLVLHHTPHNTKCKKHAVLLSRSYYNYQQVYFVLEKYPACLNPVDAGFFKIARFGDKFVKGKSSVNWSNLIPAGKVCAGDYEFRFVNECGIEVTRSITVTADQLEEEVKLTNVDGFVTNSCKTDSNGNLVSDYKDYATVVWGIFYHSELPHFTKITIKNFVGDHSKLPNGITIPHTFNANDIAINGRQGYVEIKDLPIGSYDFELETECGGIHQHNLVVKPEVANPSHFKRGCNNVIRLENNSGDARIGWVYELQYYNPATNQWEKGAKNGYEAFFYHGGGQEIVLDDVHFHKFGKYRIVRRSHGGNYPCRSVIYEVDFGSDLQIQGTTGFVCGASTYQVGVIATGGTPPYTYYITEKNGTPYTTPIEGVGNFFINLQAGDYTFKVVDACQVERTRNLSVAGLLHFSITPDRAKYCLGKPAVLEVPDMGAEVTYKWYREDDPNTPLGTDRKLTIASVTADDFVHKYMVAVKLSTTTDAVVRSCVERTFEYQIVQETNLYLPTLTPAMVQNQVICASDAVSNYDLKANLFPGVPAGGVIRDKNGVFLVPSSNIIDVRNNGQSFLTPRVFEWSYTNACGDVVSITATLQLINTVDINDLQLHYVRFEPAVCHGEHTTYTYAKLEEAFVKRLLPLRNRKIVWYPTDVDAVNQTNAITNLATVIPLNSGSQVVYFRFTEVGFCPSGLLAFNVRVVNPNNPCLTDRVMPKKCTPTTVRDVMWASCVSHNTIKVYVVSGTTESLITNENYELQHNETYVYRAEIDGCKSQAFKVSLYSDNTPPVVSCPPDRVVTVNVGTCEAIVNWTEPTATDPDSPACPVRLVYQSHRSGDSFPKGTHTVTYVYADNEGNTATCTFLVTVNANTMQVDLNGTFTNGSGSPITELTHNQAFIYEVKYKNVGAEHITSATLTVTLPNNSNMNLVGTPNLLRATQGGVAPVLLSQNGNVYTYRIPKETLLTASDERVITFALQLTGGCSEAIKPCLNYFPAMAVMTYESENGTCTIPAETKTTTTSIKINTDNCQRSELFCAGGQLPLTATGVYDSYQWYRDNTLIAGATGATYTASVAGMYRVVKTITCNGTTVTNSESINYQPSGSTTDPIRPQANNVGVLCQNNLKDFTSHFYLCNATSKVLTVNYINTNFVWQKMKACALAHETCPPADASSNCWADESTNANFTISTAGKYRLKVVGAACEEYFYFDVFTGSLQGQVLDISHKTEFVNGYFTVKMATTGVTYDIVLKDASGNVVSSVTTTENEHHFTGLSEGDYKVEVTSPQIPNCKYEFSPIKIEKRIDMTMTAEFKGWAGCNTAKFRFSAREGSPEYRFAIWSVDGIELYPDVFAITDSEIIAKQQIGQTFVEVDVPNITRVGDYIFVVLDTRNGAKAFSSPAIRIVPPSPHTFSVTTKDIQCVSSPNEGEIRLNFDTAQSRKVRLYKLNGTTRLLPPQENATGVFTGLSEGSYEVEIEVTIGMQTCLYTKKPIVINPPQNPIKAFVGVVEDASCDSQQRYKITINNVSGGKGSGYEFSFDNGSTWTTQNTATVGNPTKVWVTDGFCKQDFDVVVSPAMLPTVVVSTPTYDCQTGNGIVTVTVSSTGSYQQYKYSVDGNPTQTINGSVFTLTLAAGTHSLDVFYQPSVGMAMTQNVLFVENFGAGDDHCESGINNLTCRQNQKLLEGSYVITKEVVSNTLWVTSPTDASGVVNGRYLAIMGNGGGEILYQKEIKNLLPNTTDLHLSVNVRSLLLASSTGVNPNLSVDLLNGSTVIATKPIGTGNIPHGGNWQNYQVNFPASEVTHSTLVVAIRNNAPSSNGNEGNDLALDDILIWQDTKYCDAKVTKPITIEAGKQMTIQQLAKTSTLCASSADGTLTIKVLNPPASKQIEYSVDSHLTWIPKTLDANDTFVATGLGATMSGSITVRDPNNPICAKDFAPYQITSPEPVSVTVAYIKHITCEPASDTGGKILITGVGGERPFRTYAYVPVGGGTTVTRTFTSINMTESNIPAGVYSLTVIDKNGCEAVTTFEIKDKNPLVATASATQYCFQGGNTGEIKISVTSGNEAYQYSTDGITFVPSVATTTTEWTFGGFAHGTHTLWVKDKTGCVVSTTVTIYKELYLDVQRQQDLDCLGNSAIFKLTAEGGATVTKEFLYSLNDGAFQSIGNHASTINYTVPITAQGQYRFKVRYANADGTYCEAISTQIYKVIAEKPRFTATPTTTDVSCAGEANGTIILSANGIDSNYGLAPYRVEVRKGTTPIGTYTVPDVVSGLSGGMYELTITDAKGCVSTPVTVEVKEVPALTRTLTVTPNICKSDGSGNEPAKVEYKILTGGVAPFDAEIRYLSGGGTIVQVGLGLPNNSVLIATNLEIGDYQVVTRDAKGCIFTDTFTVNAETDILLTTAPTVAPIGCGAGTGAIKVSAYNHAGNQIGSGNFYFAVYTQGMPTYPAGTWHLGTAENVVVGGNTYPGASYEFTNLTPGVKYRFIVYDADTNCTYIQEATMPVPTQSTLVVSNLTPKPITCRGSFDGSLSFTLSGWNAATTNISYQAYNAQNNQTITTITGNIPVSGTAVNHTITGLAPGSYFVTFTENGNNCVNATAPFMIMGAPTELEVTASEMKKATCNNQGRISVAVTGGSGGYKYYYGIASITHSVTPAMVNASTDGATKDVNAGVWAVYVLDTNGCLKSSIVTVTTEPAPKIQQLTPTPCLSNAGRVSVQVKMNPIGVNPHYYKVNGGVPELVSWSSPDTFVIPNLSPATAYTIEVYDINECSDTKNITINNRIDYSVRQGTLLSCRTAIPTASFLVENLTGGTGTYFYTIDFIENRGTPSETITRVVNQTAYSTATLTLTNPRVGEYRISIYDNTTMACPVIRYASIAEREVPKAEDFSVVTHNEECNSEHLTAGTGSLDVFSAAVAGHTFRIVRMQDIGTGVVTNVAITPNSATTHQATFTNLRGSKAGIRYTIEVISNVNSCTTTISDILYAPELLRIEAGSLTATQYTCTGVGLPSLPTISFDRSKIKGGTAPYKVQIYQQAIPTPILMGEVETISLADYNGGTFFVRVTDANGVCYTETQSISVSPTFVISNPVISVTATKTCLVNEQISVSVTATPTLPAGTSIEYTLKRGSTVLEQNVSSHTSYNFAYALPEGMYEVVVKNLQTGCSVNTLHQVKQPNTYQIVATNATQPLCHSGTGAVTLTFIDRDLSDGNQALDGFTYVVTHSVSGSSVTGNVTAGTQTTTITNLSEGTYNVLATSLSGNGCTVTTQFSIPKSPDLMQYTAQVTKEVSICSPNIGEILIRLTGGQKPYSVMLVPTSAPAVTKTNVTESVLFTGLSADTYQIQITDTLGCSTASGQASITIATPTPLTVSATHTNVKCFEGNDAEIQVFATGGTGVGTYHYVLSDTHSSTQPQFLNTFRNLKVGTYTITVYDANNCSATVSVTITEPAPIDAELVVASSRFHVCYGETSAQVSVKVTSGGVAPYTVDVVKFGTSVKLQTQNNVAVNTEVLINNLPPDKYEIMVRDVNGCVMSKTVSFTVVEFPNITIREIYQDGGCVSDTYQDVLVVRFLKNDLDFSKITYGLNGAMPIQRFVRANGDTAYIDNFDRTNPDQYITIAYQDTNNGVLAQCTFRSHNFSVTEVKPLVLQQVTNNEINTIEVRATDGVPQYRYYFNGIDYGTTSVYKLKNNDPAEVDPATGIVYKVIEVKVEDAEGCTRTMTIKERYYDIEIPNFFTPDGDGNNDTWKIRHLESYPKSRTQIFDHYGRRVIILKTGESWDGNYRRKPLPSGDYWFILELNNPNDTRTFKGNFTLYR